MLRTLVIILLVVASNFAVAQEDQFRQQLQRLQQSLTAGDTSSSGAASTPANNQPSTASATTVTQAPVAVAPTQAPAPINNQVALPVNTVNPDAGAADGVANPAAAVNLPVDNDLRAEAFGRVANSALPLTPEQIRLLRQLYDASQQAAATYPGVPPKPTITSTPVDLSPGATPPVVRLSAGYVTSMVFVDATGAPWPVSAYSIGNPQAFNVQWDKTSNILLIQAISAYRDGNLAVILKGLDTPVMIELKPGQRAMDSRIDLRIPRLGPNASPFQDGLPATESPVLLSLLDGIPPANSKTLTASLCDECAFLYQNKLYLRTHFTVLSPGWIASIASADGTHVYEMEPTPVVLASVNGKTLTMTIQGY